MPQPIVPLLALLGSPLQLLVIVLILLLVFGAGRLGDIGKGLGEGIRNFKKGLAGDDKSRGTSRPIAPGGHATPAPGDKPQSPSSTEAKDDAF
jgi:sec-independent protein translocase protein TatA